MFVLQFKSRKVFRKFRVVARARCNSFSCDTQHPEEEWKERTNMKVNVEMYIKHCDHFTQANNLKYLFSEVMNWAYSA